MLPFYHILSFVISLLVYMIFKTKTRADLNDSESRLFSACLQYT